MRRVPDASGASLVSFVRDSIESGSEVRTDGWRGYRDVPNHGYTRIKTNLSDSGDPAYVVMPGVFRIASLLKTWLLGTHQARGPGSKPATPTGLLAAPRSRLLKAHIR